jgi:hypothetical protein
MSFAAEARGARSDANNQEAIIVMRNLGCSKVERKKVVLG